MTAVKCALFMAAVSFVGGQFAPLSPCPKVFTYENDGQQWRGAIKASSPHYEKQMRLQVSLSLGAKLPTNYSGSIELIGDRGRILVNLLSGLPITYNVNFPLLTPLPKVTKISMNGRVICSGPPESLRHGVKFVTDIRLEHVLQTGDGPADPDDQQPTQQFVPNNDYIPNPDNFAQPRPPKPRPDDQQNAVSENPPQEDDNYFSNAFPDTQIYQKPVQQKPQSQGSHYAPVASAKPRPPKPPNKIPPALASYPFEQNNVPVTSNTIQNPQLPPLKPLLVNVHGQPQNIVNYQVTQDRNVTKSETFHGTPENNQSSFNYHYYEVNKTETVVNRFSYEWANTNPGIPVHMLQQPQWKESQVEPQEMSDVNEDGSISQQRPRTRQRNKREIEHNRARKKIDGLHAATKVNAGSHPPSEIVSKRLAQPETAPRPKSAPLPRKQKSGMLNKRRHSKLPASKKSKGNPSARKPARQKIRTPAQRPRMTTRKLYARLP